MNGTRKIRVTRRQDSPARAMWMGACAVVLGAAQVGCGSKDPPGPVGMYECELPRDAFDDKSMDLADVRMTLEMTSDGKMIIRGLKGDKQIHEARANYTVAGQQLRISPPGEPTEEGRISEDGAIHLKGGEACWPQK
ncbi:MAG: hypothetical protein AB7P31_09140 [Steroidobacteraceae bacterium]